MSTTSLDRAFWTLLSDSVSSEAVASSMMMIGASFSIALAMDILCLSPPESLLPFSPITVPYPSGRADTNSSHIAASAAASTSSSDAPLLPMRMFSITVVLNSTTSWNTMEYLPISVSGSTVDMSMPPRVICPLSTSQNLVASLATVDFPSPDGPTSAVTSPCLATKETSSRTVWPPLYENPTFLNSIS